MRRLTRGRLGTRDGAGGGGTAAPWDPVSSSQTLLSQPHLQGRVFLSPASPALFWWAQHSLIHLFYFNSEAFLNTSTLDAGTRGSGLEGDKDH